MAKANTQKTVCANQRLANFVNRQMQRVDELLASTHQQIASITFEDTAAPKTKHDSQAEQAKQVNQTHKQALSPTYMDEGLILLAKSIDHEMNETLSKLASQMQAIAVSNKL